jgi:hypothetical protein
MDPELEASSSSDMEGDAGVQGSSSLMEILERGVRYMC